MAKEVKDTKALKEELAAKRKKAFQDAVKEANKSLLKATKAPEGEIAISLLGDNNDIQVKRISSGSVVLDSCAGGGFGEGRIIEIYGPESSGKTSIALNAIADVQRRGGNAAFIDAENALDPTYARILGVDTSTLAVSQLSIAEEVFFMIRSLLSSQSVDLIVVDSIAQLIPREEFENPEKVQVALLARVMSKQLRYLAREANRVGCTIIFLNQIREKVGVMFGNPETTPGGRALKFAASQRIEVRRVGFVKEDKEMIGTEVRLKVVKNKIGAPFQEGVTVLTFKKGINRAAEMVVIGEEFNILTKKGNTFFYTPEKEIKLKSKGIAEYTGNGLEIKVGGSKAKAIEALEESKNLFDCLVEEVQEELRIRREGSSTSNNEEEVYEEDLDDLELEVDILETPVVEEDGVFLGTEE